MLRSWRFWIGLAISAISLYFAFQGVRWDQLGAALVGMEYVWLIPATLFFAVSYTGRVFRWQLLFSPQHVRWWNVFHTLNIGYFMSNILPARLGDFIRAYLLADIEGVSKVRALSTVVVERLLDGLSVVLVLAATALFVPSIPTEAQQAAVGVAFIGILGLAVLLFLAFQKERGMALLHRLTDRISFLQRPALWRALESLLDGFAVVRSPRPILSAGGWSLDAWVFGGLMYWAVIQAMHLPVGLPAAFLVMTVTSLFVVVPSAPGYIGVFHVVARQTLVSVFGVNPTDALSYAIVIHAFPYIWLIVLGAYSIWHEGLTYRRLQAIG